MTAPIAETEDTLVADLDALDSPEETSEPTEPAEPTEPPAELTEPAESPPDPFADALKEAVPVTYKVDGTDRSFDGIVVTKSGHGMIQPDKMERFRNTLGLAEKSIADNRVLYERTRRFDQLGGETRIAELAEQVAQLDAAGTHLLGLLNDPTQLLMLDAQGNVVKNPKAIADLTEKLQFASRIAGFEAKEQFQSSVQSHQQYQADATQQGRALDAVIAQMKTYYPDLTDADLSSARNHFAGFANALFRQATPADAQQYGYRVGELLIDTPKMRPFFEERAAFRQEQAGSVKARAAAADENRKRQQAASPPTKPRRSPEPARNDDGTFARQHRDREAERQRIRSAINRAHKRGEFYADSQTERDV